MSRPLLLLGLFLSLIAGCNSPPVEVDAGPPDAGPEPPRCDDLRRNGTESDIDCGGSCEPCVAGKDCETGEDCASRVCSDINRCAPPSCEDPVINGDETGLNCGGLDCPACANGQGCEMGSDCASTMCEDRICRGPLCTNGSRDGLESDIDCGGGDCAPCDGGKMCTVVNQEVDCLSERCMDGLCTEPSCGDGIQNRDEGDTDCGGSECSPCAVGRTCNRGSDCVSLSCGTGLCRNPNCGDGIQNGAELGIDCGPVCAPTMTVCPTCNDGIRNGYETAIDCGGSICPACGDGGGCRDGDDCEFGICTHGWCGVGLAFAGFASWTQDCTLDSDVDQDNLMNAACAVRYIGARAATTAEMTSEGLVLGQPRNNITSYWVMGTCPGCAGLDHTDCVDGHGRTCNTPGADFFEDWPTHGTCRTNTRSAMCIFDDP